MLSAARFEAQLAYHEPTVSIPFWDTVLDEPLTHRNDSVLWSSDLFGDSTGTVLTGPFAGKQNPAGLCSAVFGDVLQRGTRDEQDRSRHMLSNDLIQYSLLRHTTFSDVMAPATSFPTAQDASSVLETHHGGFHGYVGGSMGSVPCSPVDPIFWPWHASLDCLWEEFRTESQTSDRQTEFPVYPGMQAGYMPRAPMQPFNNFPNTWGLSDHFTTYRYSCAVRPTKYTCTLDDDCNSQYLFCHCGQCVSKIQERGSCNKFEGSNACYCKDARLTPLCSNGRCECSARPEGGV